MTLKSQSEHSDQTILRFARWIVGVSLGIGLLVVLSQVQIPYFLYYPRTTQPFLVSASYDYYLYVASSIMLPFLFWLHRKGSMSMWLGGSCVWVGSFILALINEPSAVVILYATTICASLLIVRSKTRRQAATDVLAGALVVLTLVEWSSLSAWIGVGVNPHGGFSVISQRVEADVTFFLYPLAVPMMVLLLFSWLWVPMLPRLMKAKTHLTVRYQPSAPNPDLRMVMVALDLVAIFALIIFYYPYLAGQTWVIGQDSYWRYIDQVNGFAGLAPSQIYETSASHGAYVLLIYLIQQTTGISDIEIVKFAPLFLAFSTASAVFFAALRGGFSYRLSILSALCTLLWFPTTVAIFVAIQANWASLLIWMLFLILFFSSKEPRHLTYAAMAVASALVLLIHPWTWGVFVATLALTAVIARRSVLSEHCKYTLLASLVAAVPLGLGAYSAFPGLRADFVNTINLYLSGLINPSSLLSFGDALVNMFVVEGPVLSPALLLLSLLGAYTLMRRRGLMASYLLAWTLVWCIGSILVAPSGLTAGNPALSETGLWRMLYISPLPFMLALGIDKCISLPKQVPASDTHARILVLLPLAPLIAVGAIFFLVWDVNVRLILFAACLVLEVLIYAKMPEHRGVDKLIALFLILILLNAAFRTLFPLVLDPHNIFSSVVPGK